MKNKISLLFACFSIVATSMIAQEPVKVRKTQDPVKVEPAAKPTPKADQAPVAEPAANKPAPASTVTVTPLKKRSTLQRSHVKQKTATAMPVDQKNK